MPISHVGLSVHIGRWGERSHLYKGLNTSLVWRILKPWGLKPKADNIIRRAQCWAPTSQLNVKRLLIRICQYHT